MTAVDTSGREWRWSLAPDNSDALVLPPLLCSVSLYRLSTAVIRLFSRSPQLLSNAIFHRLTPPLLSSASLHRLSMRLFYRCRFSVLVPLSTAVIHCCYPLLLPRWYTPVLPSPPLVPACSATAVLHCQSPPLLSTASLHRLSTAGIACSAAVIRSFCPSPAVIRMFCHSPPLVRLFCHRCCAVLVCTASPPAIRLFYRSPPPLPVL
jgi:hypothetical protein